MICAPVAAVSGTVVTTGGVAGPAVSGRSFEGEGEGEGEREVDAEGRVFVAGCAGAGRAVSGQSLEDERVFGTGRADEEGAVSGQSLEEEVEGRVLPGGLVAGCAVSGQSFEGEGEGEGEGRVVVADRLGAGGGFFSAFSRA